MNDESLLELVSTAADGELSAERRDELDRLLMKSDEARRFQADLGRIDALLRGMPILDPPESLRSRIVSQLPRRHTGNSFRNRFRLPLPAAPFRYALASIAGLLLAVAFYESPPGFFDGHESGSELVGTIAPESNRSQVAVVDSVSLREPGLESTTQLRKQGNRLLLDVFVAAEEPLGITLDFTRAGVSLSSVAQESTPVEFIEYADGVLRIRAVGRGRIAVHLNRVADTGLDREAQIRLEYSSKGGLLQQGSLKPAW